MTKQLIGALVKARQEFTEVQKDKKNPHFKTQYASLDSVLGSVTPALSKYGLTIVQCTEIEEGAFVLKTYLYHDSGEHILSRYPLPQTPDAQKTGSAITYARRYSVCAILSIAPDEDDDGNGAKGASQTKHPQKNPVITRLAYLRSLTGHSPEDAREVVTALNLNPNTVATWPEASCDKFRAGLFADWALTQGIQKSFATLVSEVEEVASTGLGRDDEALWKKWQEVALGKG